MGRQWNQIIESLGPLSGGTGLSINANLTEIEALLTTLQADIVDGIIVSSGSSVITGGTLGQLTGGTVNVTNTTRTVTQGTAANLKAQATIVDSNGTAITYAATGTAGTPSSDVITVQGISSGTPLAIGTRGTLTRGTLTASTSQGTLFASNTSRNYLLVQCTSGTAFIDTGGTATTTDGIQLTSGQGIVWETGFIPTGAVVAITSTGTAQLIGRSA